LVGENVGRSNNDMNVSEVRINGRPVVFPPFMNTENGRKRRAK